MLFTALPVSADSGVLTVERTVSPETIFLPNSGYTPETSTVSISVVGYEGSITQILPIGIVFTIDGSGSMEWNDPTSERLTAVKNFIDNLDPSLDTVGVFDWDDGINSQFGLTNDFVSLKSHIDGIVPDGGTNLNVGLQASINMLNTHGRVDSAKAIIFITDGQGII